MGNDRSHFLFQIALAYLFVLIILRIAFNIKSSLVYSLFQFIGIFLLIADFMRWKNIDLRRVWFLGRGYWKNLLTELGFKFDKRPLIGETYIGTIGGVLAFIITLEVVFPRFGYPPVPNIGLHPNIMILVMMFLPIAYGVSLGPVVEEILFRGYLINRFRQIFGIRNKQVTLLSGIVSVFIFSGLHPDIITRIPRAVIFTSIYLWNQENRLAAAILAHATSNLLLSLLLIKMM